MALTRATYRWVDRGRGWTRVPFLVLEFTLLMFALFASSAVLMTVGVVYAVIGFVYTLPAWLAFAVPDDQLSMLNEQPFFVAFGVGVFALAELLTVWKERTRRFRHPTGHARCALCFEAALVVVCWMGGSSLTTEYTTTQAVVVGAVIAAMCVAAADLGQAILALQGALRSRIPRLPSMTRSDRRGGDTLTLPSAASRRCAPCSRRCPVWTRCTRRLPVCSF